MSSTRSRVLPNALLRGVLVLCGLALGLIVWEVALRWMESPPPLEEGRRALHELHLDRPWLYRLRPGATGYMTPEKEMLYHINAQGFRDLERVRPKPIGTYRILVLGDSVTFGFGVQPEESFTRLLEAEFTQRAGGARIEVLNLGVGGYNPYTEAELFKDIGVGYEPDLVVVQFCINDFDDPTKHFDLHAKQQLGLIPDAAYPNPAWRRAPLEEPYLPARYCRASRVCSRVEDALRSAFGTRLSASERELKPGVNAQNIWWFWLDERYAEIEAAAAAVGSSFAVLVVPYRSQLDDDAAGTVQEVLQLIAEQRGWLMVDPLPRFRYAHADGIEVLVDEWHPTPRGHRILSNELLTALTCRGPLPASVRLLCSD